MLEDVLHIYRSGYVETLPKDAQKTYKKEGFFEKLTASLKYIGSYFFSVLTLKKRRDLCYQNIDRLRDQIWFYANTKNQLDTLVPLFEKMSYESKWVSEKIYCEDFEIYYLKSFSRLFRIRFLKFFKTRVANKTFFKSYWDKVLRASGLIDHYKQQLKKVRPKAIVFANDHAIEGRSILHAAKKLKIPTVYIQHASVSKFFPPLMHDLCLLEGQDAYDKYLSIGDIRGDVKLVGSLKILKGLNKKEGGRPLKNMAVCFSLADDIEIIESLVTTLVRELSDVKITVRPHPREHRSLEKIPKEVLISKSKQEDVSSFLAKQDVIVAGESSIHLEATLMNVLSIHYQMTKDKNFYDYYGYIKNDLVETVKSDIHALINAIKEHKNQIPNVIKKAQYYNASIDQDNGYNSVNLSEDYINQLIRDNL